MIIWSRINSNPDNALLMYNLPTWSQMFGIAYIGGASNPTILSTYCIEGTEMRQLGFKVRRLLFLNRY